MKNGLFIIALVIVLTIAYIDLTDSINKINNSIYNYLKNDEASDNYLNLKYIYPLESKH